MRVEVTTPEACVGGVIGDLNARRGIIVETRLGPIGQDIIADVPLAEMFGYVGDLRSLSSGRASFTMALLRYGKMPEMLLEQALASA